MATEGLTYQAKVAQEICGTSGNKIHSTWLFILFHSSPTSFVCLAGCFQLLVSVMWTCTLCTFLCYSGVVSETEKLHHKPLFFFSRMVHCLAKAFFVCTSLNCYRNILLSLIISLQFDLHFLSVLSRAVYFLIPPAWFSRCSFCLQKSQLLYSSSFLLPSFLRLRKLLVIYSCSLLFFVFQLHSLVHKWSLCCSF